MAKKNSTAEIGTKSDAVRKALKAHPKSSVKEVHAALQEQGVEVSLALVNKIKYAKKSTSRGRGVGGAKKSRGHGSKATAIREMFESMGMESRSRDIVAALKERGVKVNPSQVSLLRKQLGSLGTAMHSAHNVSLSHLHAAKQLADRLGGIEIAQAALDSLSKLLK